MAAAISNGAERAYARVDTADDLSPRPDFAMTLYPGHLWAEDDEPDNEHIRALTLAADIHVSAQTPPTLIVQAQDDPVDDVRHSLAYYMALREAHVPTELISTPMVATPLAYAAQTSRLRNGPTLQSAGCERLGCWRLRAFYGKPMAADQAASSPIHQGQMQKLFRHTGHAQSQIAQWAIWGSDFSTCASTVTSPAFAKLSLRGICCPGSSCCFSPMSMM